MYFVYDYQINMEYLPKQHLPLDVGNTDAVFFFVNYELNI
jgi:hypothetical protein